MIVDEIKLAAEKTYPMTISERRNIFRESDIRAFIAGAQYVLSQQPKDKKELHTKFINDLTDSDNEIISMVGGNADYVFEWFLLQKEDSIGTVSEYQLCPKCNGAGRLINAYTTTDIYSQCDVCSGAKILVKPIVYPTK